MNKRVKIIIGVIITIIVIWGVIFAIDYTKCSNMQQPIFVVLKGETNLSQEEETYQGLGYRVEVTKDVTLENKEQIIKVEMYILNKFITGAISEINSTLSDNAGTTTLERMIMVNGKLYYDIGKESTAKVRCGNMDGKITTNVSQNEMPTKDNQSNFKGYPEYQYGAENTIEVKIDNKWFVFKNKEISNVVKIEYEGQTIIIEDEKNQDIIKNILTNLKYNNEICDGINTHTITLNNDVYYIKEYCKEIQKGNKQAKITDKDLNAIKSIIDNNKE